MNGEDDEFQFDEIEPIEGQMCYDELLLPVEEEKKEEAPTILDGQIDIWSLPQNEKTEEKTVEDFTEKIIEEKPRLEKNEQKTQKN